MKAHALLSAERAADRPAAVARVALSRRKPRAECPRYTAALGRALWEEFPPFSTELYADLYRAASASGQWLAMSLMTAAEREGEDARRLWSLAAGAEDEEERQLLKRHACDASEHALACLSLLDLTFPGAIAPQFRAELDQLSPQYTMEQELPAAGGEPRAARPSVGLYMQMNIAEIRATIQQLLRSQAVAAHCPPGNRRRANKILDSLLTDKLGHVAYTAVLIEREAGGADGGEFQALFCKHLRDFNNFTSEEPIEFSYNKRFGIYP